MYENKSERGGRPNLDEVLMVKMLVLQQWHGLSDPELEKQVTDRISFRKFLGFPTVIPDFTTVWYFRERLAKTGKDRAIWEELQRQLDSRGLKAKRGVAQDATFITSHPGHAKGIRHEGTKRKRGEARMAHGQRKAVNPSLATSSTVSRTWTMDS
jgi:IS5 family transposase